MPSGLGTINTGAAQALVDSSMMLSDNISLIWVSTHRVYPDASGKVLDELGVHEVPR